MAKTILKAETRKELGRKAKKLRKSGIIPANIYGKGIKSQAIQVEKKAFEAVYKIVGETGIVELSVGKKESPVLIHNLQVHPVTSQILHIDFLEVNLKEKVTTEISLEIIGESPAEKSGIGTVVLLMQTLAVEALPTDIPKSFQIDATKLTEVDQAVKVSDLDYDKNKIEIKAEMDAIVAKVEPPQKEEVVAAPVAETPAEGEKVAEGEKPAEPQEEKKEESQAK